MDYKGKDFDGERVQQYAALTVEMTKKALNAKGISCHPDGTCIC